MVALKYILLIVFAYFMGNITFARILAKNRNDDITKHGSGNPGTMNMLRTHGLTLGVCTLLFDAVKCVVPCLIGSLVLFNDNALLADISIYVAGLACVLGHMYPVIYKFKGGKGVASAFGMALVANPLVTGICFVVFVVTLIIFKIASLSSMICALGFVITSTVLLAMKEYYMSIALLWVLCILIIYAHRSNIKRLVKNNENKIDLNEVIQKDKDYAKAQKEKKQKLKEENINNNKLKADSENKAE